MECFFKTGNFQFIKTHIKQTHTVTKKGALEMDAVFNGNKISKYHPEEGDKYDCMREDKY